jgi:glycosyltransferase involved in cell wall biosynthesis
LQNPLIEPAFVVKVALGTAPHRRVSKYPFPTMASISDRVSLPESDRKLKSPAAGELLVSVVIPCLNEAPSIERCVSLARDVLSAHEISGEVVVVDNGSTDGSAELAARAGAHVIHESRRGYGSAYLAGFAAARGTFIVMADADLTYDFNDIPRFLEALEDGAELVMGDRMDNIKPGAMPWLHRYVGNPVLTGVLNLFFRTGVNDAHCGMRALRRDVLPRLDLRTTGMEFASEMVIRASKEQLAIGQIPIEYHPREGESKLSSFRDGWRHLRFLLVHSPTHLFLLPGAILSVLGVLIMATVVSDVSVLGRRWDLHAMIGGSLLAVVGTQILALGLCARAYGVYVLGENDAWFERMRPRFRLEHGLLAGAALILAGLVLGGVIIGQWIASGGGALSQTRLALLGATLVIVGIQIFFSSFLLSILGLRRSR